jgi:hypothetical protein
LGQADFRQRLLAFLLRNGYQYSATRHWTKAHMRWLAGLKFAHRAQHIVFQEYLDAANECTERIERITEQIRSQVADWSRAPFVKAYQALRGQLRNKVTNTRSHADKACFIAVSRALSSSSSSNCAASASVHVPFLPMSSNRQTASNVRLAPK